MADEDKPPERPTAKLDQTEILKGLVKTHRLDGHGFRQDGGEDRRGLQRFQKRMTRVEAWKDEVDARMNRSSERVRGQSEVDLAHEAKIAAEIQAREALAHKVETIDKEPYRGQNGDRQTDGHPRRPKDRGAQLRQAPAYSAHRCGPEHSAHGLDLRPWRQAAMNFEETETSNAP